ncbi:MAG: type II toxin-antitoxin system RelE/ParE family toxin, partial [bacterium]|nr:type II toxin-antitoxin system RelE/ParE family toxin [bacterium]
MKNGRKSYSIEMTNTCHSIYRKLNERLKEKIKTEAKNIAKNPYKYEQLSNLPVKIRSYHFNYEGITYRIAYEIDEKEKLIYIKLVNTRGCGYFRTTEKRGFYLAFR